MRFRGVGDDIFLSFGENLLILGIIFGQTMGFKKILLAISLSAVALSAAAAVVDDAKKLIADGQPSKALALIQRELKAKPKDGTLNYLAAQCYLKMGDEASALPLMKTAEARQVADASIYLAEKAFGEYRFDDVSAHVDACRRAVAKSGKSLPAELQSIQERASRAQSMLDRVEKIVIIDSIAVPKADFFKAYRMATSAGRFESSDSQPAISPKYVPESGACAYWAMPVNGKSSLVKSSRLTDGSWEEPEQLGDNLNEGGDAAFPYLLSDGVTLYFANNGENSIGGYDIFISRKDEGKFLNPQNLGMPYNSIYDDYLLAIDESTGVGWWATDRNRLGDKITIYKFLPADVRTNYSADEEGVADRALARNFRVTWLEGADYTALLAKIATLPETDAAAVKPQFRFALPGGKVLTRIDEFNSPDARRMMGDYLDALADVESDKARLASLRKAYSKGDKSVGDQILKIEKNLKIKRFAVKEMANEIVRTESNYSKK